ncbi:MAG TPA: succinic semialdehyde dehydrogenase [Chloroflexia bacterium]|nr:succinic semialdehyde dehydrogenase [Chloroflexia bacterium]
MEITERELPEVEISEPASVTGSATQTASTTFAVYNPASGEKLIDLPVMSAEDVAAAVARARIAQSRWATISLKERAVAMYRWRDNLIKNKNKIVESLVKENGKPRQEVLMELLYIIDIIGYYTSNAPKFLKDQKVPLHLMKTKRALVTYHPFGVVGVIAPWNFPLILSFGDAIAALVAGNAVVIKPSEITPMTPLLVTELAQSAGFPEGLIQVVTGLGDTGAALIDNVDLIAFTGSTATGRKVMERASRRLIPVLLELGGKDPMIVLKDADLERAANGAVMGGFINAGQVCISVERVYVEEPVYDRFVNLVVDKVQKLRQGIETGTDNPPDIGPMTFPRQLEIVERQVEDARQKGAKILTGGKRRADLPGLFFQPTVMTDITDDMLVMQEETFGPVLPVVRVKNAEEAIEKANRSNYGLSSSVWSGDRARGVSVALQIEAGSTCVNDVFVNYSLPEIPFGGIKESGIGYRHGGADSLKKFCRPHSIVVDRTGLKRELYWMPYSRSVEKTLHLGLQLLGKLPFRRGK